MAQKIDTKKRVFNKAQYPKTINTQFSELGVTSIVDAISQTPTIEEFFQLYDELFYEIPTLGAKNSHEYLVKTSGEYINFEENNEMIEALQQEITSLREELLSTQIELAETVSGTSLNITGSLTPQEEGLNRASSSTSTGISSGGGSGAGSSSGGSSSGGGGGSGGGGY